jgi:CopG family nickel-responsive transcriptional regulator
MILRGPISQVRSFAEALIAERGVRHGRMHLIPVELEISKRRGEPHIHIRPFN